MVDECVHTFRVDDIWDLILPRGFVGAESFENLSYTSPGGKFDVFEGHGYTWFIGTLEEAGGGGKKDLANSPALASLSSAVPTIPFVLVRRLGIQAQE